LFFRFPKNQDDFPEIKIYAAVSFGAASFVFHRREEALNTDTVPL
jgi:hypothetical protein